MGLVPDGIKLNWTLILYEFKMFNHIFGLFTY
jgi:hypothetical protein